MSRKGPVHHCRMRSKEDPALLAASEDALLRLLDEHEFDLVVGPLGVGRHRDHVLCNRAVRNVARKRRVPVVYYEDLPYSQKLPLWRISLRARRVGLGLRPLVYSSAIPVPLKKQLATIYRSQYSPVIIQALGEHSLRVSEWAARRGAAGSDGGCVAERLWADARTAFPDEMSRPRRRVSAEVDARALGVLANREDVAPGKAMQASELGE